MSPYPLGAVHVVFFREREVHRHLGERWKMGNKHNAAQNLLQLALHTDSPNLHI